MAIEFTLSFDPVVAKAGVVRRLVFTLSATDGARVQTLSRHIDIAPATDLTEAQAIEIVEKSVNLDSLKQTLADQLETD